MFEGMDCGRYWFIISGLSVAVVNSGKPHLGACCDWVGTDTDTATQTAVCDYNDK